MTPGPTSNGTDSQLSAPSGHWRTAVTITCPNKRDEYRDKQRHRKVAERSGALVELNPDLFPPVRKTMGGVDLTMLDEFGSNNPYKKGENDDKNHQGIESARSPPEETT